MDISKVKLPDNNTYDIKDSIARELIHDFNDKTADFINLFKYTDTTDKTSAINEILENNLKVFIPYNEIAQANDSAFIKENLMKFILNGKYKTPNLTNDNVIQERSLDSYNKIYLDMQMPSEFVNNLKWGHQRQSWLWNYSYWDLENFTSIVPWFQFLKNPNYNGIIPETFNVYIGKIQVLAYDTSINNWKEVFNNYFENYALFNFYTDGNQQSSAGNPYTTENNFRKIVINSSDILEKVVHGWIGTSEFYVPSSTNYKYVLVRVPIFSNAPQGFLGFNLGLDIKKTGDVQEIGGTRTIIVPSSPEYCTFTNVEPTNYEKYLTNEIFDVLDNIKLAEDSSKINAINNRFIENSFIGQDSKEYTLSQHQNYLLVISNIGSGNVQDNGIYIICTPTSSENTGTVSALKNITGEWAEITLDGLTLSITGTGYKTISLFRI